MQGSRVDLLAEHPVAGSLPISLTENGRQHFLFDGLPDQPEFHFSNSEHVVNAPAQAVVLGSTDTIATAALDHQDQWFSVQFHPELTHDVLAVDFEDSHPHLANCFRPLPEAPRLLYNFLNGTGMLQ